MLKCTVGESAFDVCVCVFAYGSDIGVSDKSINDLWHMAVAFSASDGICVSVRAAVSKLLYF